MHTTINHLQLLGVLRARKRLEIYRIAIDLLLNCFFSSLNLWPVEKLAYLQQNDIESIAMFNDFIIVDSS